MTYLCARNCANLKIQTHIQWVWILKFAFGFETFPGVSRNEPQSNLFCWLVVLSSSLNITGKPTIENSILNVNRQLKQRRFYISRARQMESSSFLHSRAVSLLRCFSKSSHKGKHTWQCKFGYVEAYFKKKKASLLVDVRPPFKKHLHF